MSTKTKLFAVAASIAAFVGFTTVGAASASAGTTQCGKYCIDIFSKAFGTQAQPNFVETVQGGVARAGVPTELFRVGTTISAQDLLPTGGTVASFYAEGKVSAAVKGAFGRDKAAQIQFAPLGKPTGLCAALASAPYQNEGLTLQPCSRPGTTVWIIDTAVSSAPGYFALVNGATPDLVQPFGMTYYVNPATHPAQIRVAHLMVSSTHLAAPNLQLWGADFGPQG